jgi:hypothetical protein
MMYFQVRMMRVPMSDAILASVMISVKLCLRKTDPTMPEERQRDFHPAVFPVE